MATASRAGARCRRDRGSCPRRGDAAHERNAPSRAINRRLGYRETGREDSADVALDGSLVPLVLYELDAADWRRPPGYRLSLPAGAWARFGA